ncbi:hypothetical protein D3C80_1709070 [compost metagenome]
MSASFPFSDAGNAATALETSSSTRGRTSSRVTDLPSSAFGTSAAADFDKASTSTSAAASAAEGTTIAASCFSSWPIRSSRGAVASFTKAPMALPNSTGSIIG